jgi:hypothetical protein
MGTRQCGCQDPHPLAPTRAPCLLAPRPRRSCSLPLVPGAAPPAALPPAPAAPRGPSGPPQLASNNTQLLRPGAALLGMQAQPASPAGQPAGHARWDISVASTPFAMPNVLSTITEVRPARAAPPVRWRIVLRAALRCAPADRHAVLHATPCCMPRRAARCAALHVPAPHASCGGCQGSWESCPFCLMVPNIEPKAHATWPWPFFRSLDHLQRPFKVTGFASRSLASPQNHRLRLKVAGFASRSPASPQTHPRFASKSPASPQKASHQNHPASPQHHRLRLKITRLRLKVTGFASKGFASKSPASHQNHPASPQTPRLRLKITKLSLKHRGFASKSPRLRFTNPASPQTARLHLKASPQT